MAFLKSGNITFSMKINLSVLKMFNKFSQIIYIDIKGKTIHYWDGVHLKEPCSNNGKPDKKLSDNSVLTLTYMFQWAYNFHFNLITLYFINLDRSILARLSNWEKKYGLELHYKTICSDLHSWSWHLIHGHCTFPTQKLFLLLMSHMAFWKVYMLKQKNDFVLTAQADIDP